MKKIILLFVFLISGFVYSQNFGVTSIKVEKTESNVDVDKDLEVWVDLGNAYIMSFPKNAIGIKKLISLTKSILRENNLNFEKPSVDDSYISSVVDGIYDYEMLHISIKNGSSEIKKIWLLEKQLFGITLNDKSYFVLIKK